MKLFIVFKVIILSLMISGCVHTSTVKEVKDDEKYEEKEQQMSMDHNQCVSYGFPVNTVEYSNCLMKLDQQRIDSQHQKDLHESKIMEDQRLTRQMQNPGKICNSRACY
jgi:hypothetical protein